MKELLGEIGLPSLNQDNCGLTLPRVGQRISVDPPDSTCTSFVRIMLSCAIFPGAFSTTSPGSVFAIGDAKIYAKSIYAINLCYFPVFGPNMERYRMRENTDQKNSGCGHFLCI